jgi:hypothetical protein
MNPCRVFAAVALTALAPLALLAAAQEGDKGLDVKGQIKIGNHAVKMEAGKLYEIRATGSGFQPLVNINPGFFRYAPAPFQKGAENATTYFYIPPETREYRLYVSPTTFGRLPEGPLEYTLKVTRVPISKKPLLKQEGNLAAEDPPYENKKSFAKVDTHHKVFPVKLEADRFYIIDMVRKGKDFDPKDIDPFLFLEDPDGTVVARDDDGGGNLNARIVIKAPRSGDYRIIAATLRKATGPFTLTVRKQLKEKE